MAPKTSYEKHDNRNEVIFPGRMILEDTSGVKISCGAADTMVALATAHADDLLALCQPV